MQFEEPKRFCAIATQQRKIDEVSSSFTTQVDITVYLINNKSLISREVPLFCNTTAADYFVMYVFVTVLADVQFHHFFYLNFALFFAVKNVSSRVLRTVEIRASL